MKRFKIKNLVNGLDFQIEADQLVLQPEHGKPAWTEEVVTPAVLDEQGVEITPEVRALINHPAEHSIVTEDLSAEIAAKEVKQLDAKDKLAKLQSLVGKSLSASEMKLAIETLLKLLLEYDSSLAEVLVKLAAQKKQ